jgi:PAS domain S-box-containing protein
MEERMPGVSGECSDLIQGLQQRLAELDWENQELKLAVEELTGKIQRWVGVYENAPVAFFSIDRAGDVRDANLTGTVMLGLDRSELAERRFLWFVTEDTRAEFNSFLIQSFAGGPSGVCEVGLRVKNGETVFVRMSASVDRDSQLCRIAAMDITDRHQIEDDLRHNEEKYRRIVETANEAIVVTDADSRVTFFNLRASEMLGYLPDEICGREFDEFLFEEEKPIRSTRRENRGRSLTERYARRIKTKDGGWIWAVVSATPIMAGDGTLQGSFTMVTDIIDRKRADEMIVSGSKEV